MRPVFFLERTNLKKIADGADGVCGGVFELNN